MIFIEILGRFQETDSILIYLLKLYICCPGTGLKLHASEKLPHILLNFGNSSGPDKFSGHAKAVDNVEIIFKTLKKIYSNLNYQKLTNCEHKNIFDFDKILLELKNILYRK